jgi:Abortive infection alpha
VSYSEQDEQDVSLVAAMPGLIRLSAQMSWKLTEWGITTTVRAYSRVLRAAARGDSLSYLMQDAGDELRDYLRSLLEIVDPEDERWRSESDGYERAERAGGGTNGHGDRDESVEALREQGRELLRRSADVYERDGTHPAFSRVLENLAPDEGRILRLLAIEGPQASIDIRTSPPLGIGSEMVASGLNMIGREAGCRDPDRVHAYLGNLYRLGLIWFSRESLEEQGAYQVLEAQPEVQVAMSESGRTRTVRRSIHLTAFGKEFCKTCLPLDTGELDRLPRT